MCRCEHYKLTGQFILVTCFMLTPLANTNRTTRVRLRKHEKARRHAAGVDRPTRTMGHWGTDRNNTVTSRPRHGTYADQPCTNITRYWKKKTEGRVQAPYSITVLLRSRQFISPPVLPAVSLHVLSIGYSSSSQQSRHSFAPTNHDFCIATILCQTLFPHSNQY